MIDKNVFLDSLKHFLHNHEDHNSTPIFEIMIFENPCKELIYPTGKHSGFPDTGATNFPGFYHSFEDAYDAVVSNACDIRETVYDAAFLLVRFPGLYQSADKNLRLYFVYNEKTGMYEQKEEPPIFAHVSF